jgi:membrane fusion protein, multidrug efflux system
MTLLVSNNLWVGFFCVALISCKEQTDNKPSISPNVNAVSVGKENLKIYNEYVGQIYGQSDIQIQPRVEGWITGVYFKEGQMVKKGQLLYTIDDLPQRTKIDAATADVERAKAVVVNKKSDLERVQPLTAMNALSQRDLDAATAAYESAVNELKIGQARLADAKIELGYTRILSPITGMIGLSKAMVGDYVGRTALGSGINTVSSMDEMRVRFPISENEYLRFVRRIRKDPQTNNFTDIPVELILSDGSVYGEKGRIDLTNRQIDNATGSLLVQAVFKNNQRILRPGQYTKVRFQTDEFKDATVVPQQAVNQLQNIYQVFLLNDSDRVTPTIVKVGNRVGSNWVITEGLKPGDKVVMVGSAFINPKMPVNAVMMNWNYDSTTKN